MVVPTLYHSSDLFFMFFTLAVLGFYVNTTWRVSSESFADCLSVVQKCLSYAYILAIYP